MHWLEEPAREEALDPLSADPLKALHVSLLHHINQNILSKTVLLPEQELRFGLYNRNEKNAAPTSSKNSLQFTSFLQTVYFP